MVKSSSTAAANVVKIKPHSELFIFPISASSSCTGDETFSAAYHLPVKLETQRECAWHSSLNSTEKPATG
jgi:hypothetical protein